jgi:hypothetical protein
MEKVRRSFPPNPDHLAYNKMIGNRSDKEVNFILQLLAEVQLQ